MRPGWRWRAPAGGVREWLADHQSAGIGEDDAGYSKATLVVVDEAARVEDALMASLRPMLATSKGGGKMVLLSTPFGKRGAFYEYWSSGGEDWHRVEVPASSCPRISQEFLD